MMLQLACPRCYEILEEHPESVCHIERPILPMISINEPCKIVGFVSNIGLLQDYLSHLDNGLTLVKCHNSNNILIADEYESPFSLNLMIIVVGKQNDKE